MSWMLTATGKRVEPCALTPADIHLEDIAHHLAQINRFTGAAREPYSVAQHCVFVSEIIEQRLCRCDADFCNRMALQGLLHDATEAYLNDIATPVKSDPRLAGYNEIELIAWYAIADRFLIQRKFWWEVKRADLIALATERRDLMPEHPDEWAVLRDVKPMAAKIVPWPWMVAKFGYVRRFHELSTRLGREAGS
jgi:uncharacterized protein